MLQKILLSLMAALFISPLAAQEPTKEWLKDYLNSRLHAPIDDTNWYLQINGVKLPKKSLEEGLAKLEENMKGGNLSKGEKKNLRAQFVQNYTDRMTVFLSTYSEFLDSADLESLLWDFLAQASAQKYLEKQLALNPAGTTPTEEDISSYVRENSSRFSKLGLGASQVREYASMEMTQTKMQEWTAKTVADVKSKAEIKLNKAVQKELGL